MNYFLDENFPKIATRILEEKGHYVYDIRGTKNEGLDDPDIFKICIEKKALFLTTDKDYYHTIHLTNKPHFGIVVIALSKPNSKLILEKLIWFLENFEYQDNKNKCYLILDNKCKIY